MTTPADRQNGHPPARNVSKVNGRGRARDTTQLGDQDAAALIHKIAATRQLPSKAEQVGLGPRWGEAALIAVEGPSGLDSWLIAEGRRDHEWATRARMFLDEARTKALPPGDPDVIPMPVAADASEAPRCSDTGNALRLVARYGDIIRYCPQRGDWLIWDGKRWKEDRTGHIYRLARKTIQAMGVEAAKMRGDEDARRAAIKWALQSEDRKRIEAMIALARFTEGVPVEPHQLDADPWLFNCTSGTIDLRTGKLQPHRKEDLNTKLSPVAYQPDAACPGWDRFLAEVFAGDEELISYVDRMGGYMLGADNAVQEINIFHGDGANGKNVFLDRFRYILGEYGTKADAGLLMAKKFEDHPTGLADLDGKRFVAASETGDGRRLAEDLVKSLTGDDTIKARRMRENFYEFKRTFKIVLATNHKPEIRGTDLGIWRRIRLIPFKVTFYGPEDAAKVAPPFALPKIEGLAEKLASEDPGILARFVRGCVEWHRAGMRPPAAVVAATDEYRRDMDTIGQFIADACVVLEGIRVKASELHAGYLRWCETVGLRKPLTLRPFGQEMEKRGFKVAKTKEANFRHGIALCSETGQH